MIDEDIYDRREQTGVKHFILRHYLERFAHIVGSYWNSITYIDGFAGPWNARSLDLQDSSFAIALDELRKARSTHEQHGKHVRLRCFFLEQNKKAFAQLDAFAKSTKDVEVAARNSSFENSIKDILAFIRRGGANTFPFIFIDPTGWTGFDLKTIGPLLRLNPGEVLINFMTSHILRFPQQSFPALFGSAEFVHQLEGLSGTDRDDAAVAEYMRRVKEEGGFHYVLQAIVLRPEIDRAHFHLIYGTRHPKGAEVFKETEKLAMKEMEKLRAGAQRRRKEERTGQGAFSWIQTPESSYYLDLRERYLGGAKQAVLHLVRDRQRISYNDAWEATLGTPLVWESDLKEWIEGWQEQGSLKVEGLQGRERVPKRDRPHFLVWQGPR
jgi:three-Cys-motif partner protein